MKRKILILFLSAFFLTGCFGRGKEDIIKKLSKNIEDINSYYIKGELEIINNEDKYTYDVEVSYMKEDNFKVNLLNKTNNHEQIILKNGDGVYLLTPSLNKSFKFQSDWPYNNSQIYLLQTLLKDIKNDEGKIVEEIDDGYKITTSVNYSNNHNLVKQYIYIDKNANITNVEIVNKDNITKMKMKFNKIDLKATYKDDYFDLNKNMKNTDLETTSKQIEDVIYPMYMPENTYLKSQDTINLDNGERIILTFAGENPFTLIEQTVDIKDEYEMTMVYGDPEILLDTIGSITTNSVSFISGGIEYYAVSEVLDQKELLEVVNSISVIPVGK